MIQNSVLRLLELFETNCFVNPSWLQQLICQDVTGRRHNASFGGRRDAVGAINRVPAEGRARFNSLWVARGSHWQ